MKTLGISLLALLAVGALMASTAGAAKEKVVLKLSTAKGLLAKGAEIKASSENLIFVTADGNLECTENVLTGTLTTNSSTKDKSSITAERSVGKEPEEACKTTTVLGAAKIKAGDFPWTQELTTKNTGSTKGTKKVLFESKFPAAAEATCIFEAAKVAQTFTAGKAGSPTPVELTVKDQEFKRGKGSNAACPTSGKLSGTFTVTSGGETVDSEL
jgi:hypothetical protein